MILRRALFVLWISALLALLLGPVSDMPSEYLFSNEDKVVHFILFAITGLVGVSCAGLSGPLRSRLLFVLIFGLLLAGGTEGAQALIASRQPSLCDLMADAAGLSMALFAYALPKLR